MNDLEPRPRQTLLWFLGRLAATAIALPIWAVANGVGVVLLVSSRIAEDNGFKGPAQTAIDIRDATQHQLDQVLDRLNRWSGGNR